MLTAGAVASTSYRALRTMAETLPPAHPDRALVDAELAARATYENRPRDTGQPVSAARAGQ